MPSITIQQFKKELMKNPKFRAEYYKPNLALDMALAITDLRIQFGLTQAQLARKIGTKQSSIARVENGNVLPSLRFLQKIAKAVGTKFVPPRFVHK